MATNMNVSMRYSTFLPMLLEALERTDGDVLELGAGVFSTALLHWICEKQKRNLLTIESDRGWFKFTSQYLKSKHHQFMHVNNWDDASEAINKEWDVVLVDHSPYGRRIEEIKKLANLAKYLVVHDSEPWKEREHHYSQIYPLFKYQYNFDLVDHNTVVLSNFAHVEDFNLYGDKPTELCQLAIKYSCDKCPQIGHCYTPFYYEFLKNRRQSIKKVLEIGVGTSDYKRYIPNYIIGASLYMWRDFFPKAQIFGADIAAESIFTTDRLTTYYCDERNEVDIKRLISLTGGDIDLVIDDASHHIQDQIFLFQTLMPLLKKDATYVVEDCFRTKLMRQTFPQYNCFIPHLPPNKKQIRGGLVIFTYK